MPKTFREIQHIVDLRKELESSRRISVRSDIPEEHRTYFRDKIKELDDKLAAEPLDSFDRMRIYSRKVTPHLLHEMDIDVFIVPFLPFYIIGLASTVPGHVAEGIAAAVNKIAGKK